MSGVSVFILRLVVTVADLLPRRPVERQIGAICVFFQLKADLMDRQAEKRIYHQECEKLAGLRKPTGEGVR